MSVNSTKVPADVGATEKRDQKETTEDGESVWAADACEQTERRTSEMSLTGPGSPSLKPGADVGSTAPPRV